MFCFSHVEVKPLLQPVCFLGGLEFINTNMDEQEFNESWIADVGGEAKPVPAHYKAIIDPHVVAILDHIYEILPIITELGFSFSIEADGVVVVIEKPKSEQEGIGEYE
jgi:hypothetical protein